MLREGCVSLDRLGPVYVMPPGPAFEGDGQGRVQVYGAVAAGGVREGESERMSAVTLLLGCHEVQIRSVAISTDCFAATSVTCTRISLTASCAHAH